MIRAITEVGVAVHDLDAATRLLTQRLGAVPGPVQRFDPYGMEFCMCRMGNVDFELMAPTSGEGVIARFLARHGEGIHHIGFAVDDVAMTQLELGAQGLGFVDARPRTARFLVNDFGGKTFDTECDFAFTQPKSLLNMLVEFIEYPPGYELGSPLSAGPTRKQAP